MIRTNIWTDPNYKKASLLKSNVNKNDVQTLKV